MSSKIEFIEKNHAKITVHIPPDYLEEGMKHSYSKNRNKLVLPGFRAGKVPRALAEKQFGAEIFLDDAINYCFHKIYNEAIETLNFVPVSVPEIDRTEYDKENGIDLIITVWTKPEITLGKYKGLTYTKKPFEVTDADVDKVIDGERDKNARIESIIDRPVQNSDTVVINYEGFIDGEPFDGGKADEYELVIGSKTFIDTFEEQLIGQNPGEDVTVNVTFPDDYANANLRGKPAQFKVFISHIAERLLPEADDEFAQDVSEFDSIDEYKSSIKEKLLIQKEDEKQRDIEDQLLKYLVDEVDCDIPEVMIKSQVDRMDSDFKYRLAMQGLSLELYLQYTGKSLSDLENDYRESAKFDIAARLVLEAIANAEGYVPSEEDVENEIERVANSYGFNKDALKTTMGDNDIKGLNTDLKAQKALEIIKEFAIAQ